ncbi:MAG TPA: hypothetical protein VNT54_17060 [Solirubrobacteraceae bacterium]|nr:hypothetical protein [Solirubrobacteraceae bacterium]
MTETLVVQERGRTIAYSFDDMLKYHGPGSPGGVANAFKVLQRALPQLSPGEPPQRREIFVRTSFGGPGARDGFEAVTRAVSGERFAVDPALARPERGRVLERFVFEVGYRERSVTLLLREGFVTEEFIDLARKEARSAEEEAHLDVLKAELAERVMRAAADDVYDLDDA